MNLFIHSFIHERRVERKFHWARSVLFVSNHKLQRVARDPSLHVKRTRITCRLKFTRTPVGVKTERCRLVYVGGGLSKVTSPLLISLVVHPCYYSWTLGSKEEGTELHQHWQVNNSSLIYVRCGA